MLREKSIPDGWRMIEKESSRRHSYRGGVHGGQGWKRKLQLQGDWTRKERLM